VVDVGNDRHVAEIVSLNVLHVRVILGADAAGKEKGPNRRYRPLARSEHGSQGALALAL
jgi:hypothetical protein